MSARTSFTVLFRSVSVASALFVVWLIFSFQLFVNVDRLKLERTDAVVMLGGAAAERLPAARQTQEELGIPVLVLSHTDTAGNAAADAVCNAPATGSSIVCFRPADHDTRSEARRIAKLVADNRWSSVTVVTSSYHVTRAGRLIMQCTTAEVQMVASHPDLDAGEWLHRFAVESIALVDASVRPECRPRVQ